MSEYPYEVSKAARVLVDRLMSTRRGETVVITADTGSDFRAADATAAAAYECGAKPVVVTHVCPAAMGKSADPILPVEALTAVIREADVWIELDSAGLMYTTPYDAALRDNSRLRHICMGTADVDMLVRCVGRVDFDAMASFEKKLANALVTAKKMHITTPAGTDVTFKQSPAHPCHGSGALLEAVTPAGTYTMPGAIGWAPELSSINGTLVFDGGVGVPAINMGLLKNPIVLQVEDGEIKSFDGGEEAKRLEVYLRSFEHPQTLRIAHTGLGYNPGAISRCRFGNMLEDERIWGAMHWGIGEITESLIPGHPVPAPMHCDGSTLSCTVEADGALLVEGGEFIHPDLVGSTAPLRRALI